MKPAKVSGSQFFKAGPLRAMLALAVLSLACMAPSLSIVAYLDKQISTERAKASARPASGKFVFVAIDQKSLTDIGTWPWPRQLHASLIDRLASASASDIFLDIDFSSASTPEQDQRLQGSLEAAGGGVILPIFRQLASAEKSEILAVTKPLPAFAENAWTALVDVELEPDGLVRSVPIADTIDGLLTSSAAAILAGVDRVDDEKLAIDYSILPQTVPTYSFTDVLSGRVQEQALKGRSVVVGASAVELKDFFSVPVHGAISGPMLHILAAETLVQQRGLLTVPALILALASAMLVMAYAFVGRNWSLSVALIGTFIVIGTVEGAGYLLYDRFAIDLQTASVWFILAFGLVALLADKMRLKEWIAELAIAQNRDIRRIFKRVISDSIDPIVILDSKTCLVDASKTLAATLNLDATVALGTLLRDFAPAELVKGVSELLAAQGAMPDRSHNKTVQLAILHGSEPRYVDAVVTVSPFERISSDGYSSIGSHVISIVLRDVTSRSLYERKLEALARTDDLTGALSRRGLCEALAVAKTDYVLLAVDLHRFNFINETLGRDKGDRVLQAVAGRLNALAGERGLLGRIDGNILCLALPADECPSLPAMAENVLHNFDLPFDIDGMSVSLEAHLGTSLAAAGSEDPARSLESAEHALTEAKQIGGSGWKPFDPASALRRMRSRMLEAEMPSALKSGQFFLSYQPQISFETRSLIGVEALARWEHPSIGAISPGEFIPIAEANGFITELGRFMLQEACRTATGWPEHLTVAVNVSPAQFQRGSILTDVRQALAASGLTPYRLHLEITETLFLDRSEALFETLESLRNLGVSIALDDFGTGYSSLSYLTRLPLDKLKIDQSFIRDMTDEAGARSIVRTIIALAHSLKLQVIAEGVETEEQCSLLTALGCEVAQGYYFGKPMAAEQIQNYSSRLGSVSGGGFSGRAKVG